MSDSERVSKRLSYWLRHRPDAAGLTLDPSGWAPVDQLLTALLRAGLPSSRADLQQVAATNDKQRFEFSSDGSLIRARQGHSVAVDAEWKRARPPEFLYHGTVERVLPSILREGLRPMARHHVHLSPDEETAARVGARRGKPLILKVHAGRLAAGGADFRLSTNDVWLVDHVPPDFIEPIG